ncbi:MAG: hypothetical protein E8D46_18030 [Nitrospira sp.]|nr:MAG: hypothetical protein E8D46_18030 [Nitrospira sp.]
MRKTVTTITKGLYLLLTELIAVYLIAFPVHAFQVSSSSTGYVRVATASAISAYQVAQRAAFTGALASAISAPTLASVAVRLATGPVGWGLLGVSAALTLASMYYSSQEVQAVKTAALAAQPQNFTVPNYTMPVNGTAFNGCTTLIVGCVQIISVPNGLIQSQCGGYPMTSYPLSTGTPPPGWVLAQMSWGTQCNNQYHLTYNGANGQYKGSLASPASLTQTQAQTYINSLPASNPNSIESQTDPLGVGVPAPAAENVTILPVSPTDVVPTVKPASQVGPTDVVIDPNAPPPAGPQPAVPSTQTTTTTTTTTTNPDGSVTEQEASTSSVSCSAGNHDTRTFGSVLQDHMNRWQGSGLLSALNLLKTLTWPSSIPTYSLSSSLFGSFTLDFSAWSGMLTALRSLIIALSAFVAYRIIFVGNA